MKYKILIPGVLFFTFSYNIIAQDCKMYFPDKEGATREMTSYDKKGKENGKVLQEIISKKVSQGNLEVTIKQTVMDKKGEGVTSNEFTGVCEGGIFRVSMANYVDQSTLEAYKNMEIEMSGDNLAFPSDMKPGDQLKDGTYNMVVKNSGMTIITITISITDRKVLSKETLKTPAGSFECMKISYSFTSKMGIVTIKSSALEWICEGVGVVKAESYSKNGSLMAYSELTKLKL